MVHIRSLIVNFFFILIFNSAYPLVIGLFIVSKFFYNYYFFWF